MDDKPQYAGTKSEWKQQNSPDKTNNGYRAAIMTAPKKPYVKKENLTCFKCGKVGHLSYECSEVPARSPSGVPVHKRMCSVGEVAVSPVLSRMSTQITDIPQDGLFRIPVRVRGNEYSEKEVQLEVLADSGSNVDVISQQALEMLQVEVGNLVITPGEPMKIQLASREQVMDGSGDTAQHGPAGPLVGCQAALDSGTTQR
jgi:hypothetical protein